VQKEYCSSSQSGRAATQSNVESGQPPLDVHDTCPTSQANACFLQDYAWNGLPRNSPLVGEKRKRTTFTPLQKAYLQNALDKDELESSEKRKKMAEVFKDNGTPFDTKAIDHWWGNHKAKKEKDGK
jgi:hypothetical protein